MTLEKHQKEEIKRLEEKYSKEEIFYKNDLFESLPHPSPLSFSVIKKIYQSKGPLSVTLKKLGVKFDKKKWANHSFLETIFGTLMINKSLERDIFEQFETNFFKSAFFEIKKHFLKRKIEKDFYRVIFQEVGNLRKDFSKNDLFKNLTDLTDFYKNVFLINFFLKEAERKLKCFQEIDDKSLNLILNHSSRKARKTKEKEDPLLIEILNDWSFRTSLDLEFFSDKYIKEKKIKRKENFDISKIVKVGEAKKRMIESKTEELLFFEELSQDIKHLTSLLFNDLRKKLFKKSGALKLKEKKDICFLEMNELKDLKNISETLRDKIESRKEKYFSLQEIKIKNSFSLKEKEKIFKKNNKINRKKPEKQTVISGKVFSTGSFSGRVVFLGRKDSSKEKMVLVVPAVTPDIVIEYFRTGAIISEVGSRLSHGVIVAREYGIPVILVENAMNIFQEGQKVIVDSERQEVIGRFFD